MRIYNGTDSQVNLPLNGSQRITIAPHAVSGDIMGSSDFLSLLVTSYNTDELALIVSGPYELNMCANIPVAVNYVVQSLDEAVARFNKSNIAAEEPKKEEKVVAEPEVTPLEEPVVESEVKVEEVEAPVVEETPVEAAPVEEEAKPVVEEPVAAASKKSSKKGKRK